MPNLIFRGPISRAPRTITNKVAAAAGIKPGTFVTETATTVAQATAFAPGLLIAANRDYLPGADHMTTADPMQEPYAAGDSVTAYVPEPADQFQCAMAAATYTFNQELAVGAAGRLQAAVTGNVVVALFKAPVGALAAGALADVEITSLYPKA